MNARIKTTGEIKSFYPTTRGERQPGFVDADGRLYYPEELVFNPDDARAYMVSTLDMVINGLKRNKEILMNGGRLENEHWADIAQTFRNAMYFFGNQHNFQ